MLKGTKIFYGWWIVLACLLLITLTVPFTSALVSLYTIPITEEFDIPRSALYINNDNPCCYAVLFYPQL